MCPLCKNESFINIGLPAVEEKSKKILRKDFRVVQCGSCRFYYVHPKIDFTQEEWRLLYDENYFADMSKWHETNRERERKERFDRLDKLSGGSIKNFLDVGCGEGFCLLEAEKRGWNAFGIDINDNRIDKAKDENISFTQADLIGAGLPADFFDAVYLDSVLEHVTNPADYLAEIKRILKPGGLLYIGVPNEDSLLNDVKYLAYKILSPGISHKIKPFKSPYHVVGFNRTSLKFALEKSNLKILKLRNFACRLEFLKSKPFSSGFFTQCCCCRYTLLQYL